MNNIFRKEKEKEKIIAIIVETTGDFAKTPSSINSIPVHIDERKTARELVLQLLSRQITNPSNVNEHHYELCFKGKHNNAVLDNTKTLKENKVKTKDVIIFRRREAESPTINISPPPRHTATLPKRPSHIFASLKRIKGHKEKDKHKITSSSADEDSPSTTHPQYSPTVESGGSSPMTRAPSLFVTSTSNSQIPAFSKENTIMRRISRTLSLAKNVSTDPRRKLQFGISLRSLLDLEEGASIPFVIDRCLDYIEKNALEEPRLFLQKVDTVAIEKLRRHFEAGGVDLVRYDPHVLANLILHFLDCLPDPIISNKMFSDLIKNESEGVAKMSMVVSKLPEENFCLLQRLAKLFKRLLDHKNVNYLELDPLSVVFGNVITRQKNISSDNLFNGMARVKNLGKFLIVNCDEVLAHFVSTQAPNTAAGEVTEMREEEVLASHHTAVNDDTWAGNVACGTGVIWLTNYQLIWRSGENEENATCVDIRLPYRSIWCIEKFKKPSRNIAAGIRVVCRNFRCELFSFADNKICKKIFKHLSDHVFDDSIQHAFAYISTEVFGSEFTGWKVYKMEVEAERQGFVIEEGEDASSNMWRVCDLNKSYEICEIYPKKFVVPSVISDAQLRNCANYRDASRIPILTWKHPTNHAMLLRSGPVERVLGVDDASPTTSPVVASRPPADTNTRVDEDGNAFFNEVLKNVRACRAGNAELEKLPSTLQLADMGTRRASTSLTIGSVEEFIWYTDIAPPQIMMAALQGLMDATVGSSHTDLHLRNPVELNNWFHYLRCIVYAARKIAGTLQSGVCVVLQGKVLGGSEITEFTFVSLTMILADPFYRTIQGFMILIEKEWLAYAFPFAPKNTEHTTDTQDNTLKSDLAPSFLQFLDCLWQVYQDIPYAFEFNEAFLVFLADESFFGRFGTFLSGIDRDLLIPQENQPNLANLAKDRIKYEYDLKTTTTTVWDYVHGHRTQFLNPLYDAAATNSVILPDTKPNNFRLWSAFYLRFCKQEAGEYWKRVNYACSSGETTLSLNKLNLPCFPLTEEVTPFQQLTHLQQLDVSNNQLNVFPVDLLFLTNLKKLNMEQNFLRTFPSPYMMKILGNSLEELNLSENAIGMLPIFAELKKFQNLQTLRIAGNKFQEINFIVALSSLKTLDVKNNFLPTLPKNINGLSRLQELNVRGNLLTSLPENWAGMNLMKDINLANNQLESFPIGITQLPNLTNLDLSGNSLSSITEQISNLQNLRSLNFAHNKITEMTSGLMLLTKLLDLSFDNNQIEQIHPNISQLSLLLKLSLSHNFIEEIPLEIGGLYSLREVTFSNNRITDISPAIGQLHSMVTLDLSGNNDLTVLPPTLGNLVNSVHNFEVDLSKITNVPQEICAKGSLAVIAHLAETLKSTQPAYRVKLMVVGRDNVGKTSLMNCLRKKYKKYADNCSTISTDGIDIGVWNFVIEDDHGERHNAEVSVWDMAGQEVYYTTHNFFLSESTIYIVVWNVVEGEIPDGSENKIEYWLRALKARCGTTIPPAIFIVGTHIDDPEIPKTMGPNIVQGQRLKYKAMFPELTMHFRVVSCSSGENIDILRKDIQLAAVNQKSMGRGIANSWFLLERCLMRESLRRVPPLMNEDDVHLLGQACGVSEQRQLQQALNWLHDTGIIIVFRKDGATLNSNLGVVILDPRWLSNTLATLFTTRHQWFKKGFMLYKDLIHIWKPPMYPTHLHRALLSLAEDFEIVYLIEKKSLIHMEIDARKTSLSHMVGNTSTTDLLGKGHQRTTSPPADYEGDNLVGSGGTPSPPNTSSSAISSSIISSSVASSSVTSSTSYISPPSSLSTSPSSSHFSIMSPSSSFNTASPLDNEDSASSVINTNLLKVYDGEERHLVRKLSTAERVVMQGWQGDGSPKSSSHNTNDEDLVILIPSLLPPKKPDDLSSFWKPIPDKNTETQIGRRYVCDFIPVGLFGRVIIRLMNFSSAKLFWRDGIILEHYPQNSDSASDLIFVEIFPEKKTIDVFIRSKNKDGTPREVTRQVLECVETLARDCFQVQYKVFVPCIHCLLAQHSPLNRAPPSAKPEPTRTVSSKTRQFRTLAVTPVPTKKNIYYFPIEKCESAAVAGLTYINCEKVGKGASSATATITPVKLSTLVPDLTMEYFTGKRIEFGDITMGPEVGAGGAATVYRGEWQGKTVAVKMLKKTTGTDVNGNIVDAMDKEAFSIVFGEFRREAHIMSDLDHPSLVRFEGLCVTPLCIVTEFMDGGDLYHFLHNENNTFDWNARLQIATDVAAGVGYLHRGGFVHRDLKSPNIMLNSEKRAKVTDFGLSGLSSIVTGRAVANPVWLAPEILRGEDTALADQSKIDVYSYGVILWELVTRADFFGEFTFMTEMEKSIIAGKRPPIPEDCHPLFTDLIESCWATDPTERPTFAEISSYLVEVKASFEDAGVIPKSKIIGRSRSVSVSDANHNKNNEDTHSGTKEEKIVRKPVTVVDNMKKGVTLMDSVRKSVNLGDFKFGEYRANK